MDAELAIRVFSVMTLLTVVGSAAPTAAAPVQSEGTTAYEEDFATYSAKSYTYKAEWDIFTGHLSLSPRDAVDQSGQAVAGYDNGDSIIVWKDARDGDYNIYAQRLDSRGNRLWKSDLRVNSLNGSAVSFAPLALDVAVDGEGRAFVAWQDTRNDLKDVYAQKVDAEGKKLWASDVRVSSTSGGWNMGGVSMATDENGGIIVVWHRNGIHAQRIESTGAQLWSSEIRVDLSDEPGTRKKPVVGVDANNDFIVAWCNETYPEGWYALDIYAQRVSSDGSHLWENDVRVSGSSGTGSSSDASDPAIAVESSGHAFVFWGDKRGPDDNGDIYAQRLSPAGSRLWPDDLRVNSDTGTASQGSPTAALLEDNTVLVAWAGDFIRAQRLNNSGVKLWADDTRVNWESYSSSHPAMAVTNDGSAVIAWKGDPDSSIYANSIDLNGDVMWEVDVPVNQASGSTIQSYPDVAVDASGRAMVTWQDTRQGRRDLYAMAIDSDGERLWSSEIQVNDDHIYSSPHDAVATMNPDGEVTIAWVDYRNGADIYAQRMDMVGNHIWSADVRVHASSSGASQRNPAADSNPDASVIVVWEDERNGNLDIYAQTLDPDGNPLWPSDVRVNSDTGTSTQRRPAVVTDGDGSAVIVWEDCRHYSGGGTHGEIEVYAQRLEPTGAKSWTSDVRVSPTSTSRERHYPDVAMDSTGNAVVVWEDWNLMDVYAQSMDSDGNRVWTNDLRVSDVEHSWSGSFGSSCPAIAADRDGNTIVTWRDGYGNRGGARAQKLDASGTRLWVGDVQIQPELPYSSISLRLRVDSDAAGDVVVTWADDTSGNSDAYAQRLDDAGNFQWSPARRVVSPDYFYHRSGRASSNSVDAVVEDIKQASLTANYQTNSGSVQFYLTNDGGQQWAEVTPGVNHVFTTTGSDLRWRAELTADPIWLRTPVVSSLRIEYSTVTPGTDDYERDDTCAQASPLQVNGAVQAHTFHQAHDKDWAWFDASAGTTYVLQTAHAGPNADTVLELHDVCHHPILTDTNAFGRDARLTFTAPSDGTYYARVANHDGSVYDQGTDYDLSVRTYHPNGLAVVVAGHNDRWQLQSNIDYATDHAYLTFLEAGFPKANVRYLGPDPGRDVDGNGSNDDIAATATITNVRYAIQDWPREQGLGLGIPFYVYLMDHGHYDLFLADGDAGRVTAPLLDLWLSNLEATTGADQITVVIDACKSGSFIDVTGVGPDEISGANRVVVASTTSQANAYPSQRGALFSDAFWTALGDNQDVWSAYRAAKTAVDARGLMQTPWLDDNGDAVAKDDDGDLARGRGLAGVFGGGEPVIDWLEVGEVSASGEATVRAQVRDDFAVMDVYVEVYPSGYEEPEAPPGETPEVDVPTTTLTLEAGEVYEATLTDLTKTGNYRVVGYAVDDEGNWALPQWASVLAGLGATVYLPLIIRSN